MENAPVSSSFVKLLVSDAERSARFYEALGFARTGAAPPFLHLKWDGQAEVYLVAAPPTMGMEGRRGVGVLLGFRATAMSLENLAARAQAQGAPVEGPQRQPWHTRELVVVDPDGYRLNFIEPA